MPDESWWDQQDLVETDTMVKNGPKKTLTHSKPWEEEHSSEPLVQESGRQAALQIKFDAYQCQNIVSVYLQFLTWY